MKTQTHFLISTLLALFLAACSSVPQDSERNLQWEQHRAALEQLVDYQASGKIAYKSPEENIGLNFHWKQSPTQSELRLFNFLGATILKLTMTPDDAVVITGDNETYRGTDAESLVTRLTGLVIPVAQMKDWLKGLPTEAQEIRFNETDTIQSLITVNGSVFWQLTYDRYQDSDQYTLPYQMTLNSPDTRIKIVVSKWVTNE